MVVDKMNAKERYNNAKKAYDAEWPIEHKSRKDFLNFKIDGEERLKQRAKFEKIKNELDAAEIKYFG